MQPVVIEASARSSVQSEPLSIEDTGLSAHYLMSLFAKTERQEKNLALAAAPGRTRIEMENAEPLHPLEILSAKALKIPRSHGSGESFSSSGCHCTPSTHQSSDFDSSPSTIPSGACAVAFRAGAISSADWWCREFTVIRVLPTAAARREPGSMLTSWTRAERSALSSC